MRQLLLLALWFGCWAPAYRATAPRYLLSRAEPYTVKSDGMVMLHYDL